MKNFSFLILAVFLVGCETVVPIKQKFPDPVEDLRVKCPDLQQIEGKNVAITDMLKVIVKNYNAYYMCADKVDGWNEWYDKQKKIFESVQ